MTVFALFAPLLRRARFRKTWDTRAGGLRTTEWRREEPDGRTLVCHISEDGQHSLSHSWLGCGDTMPTYFKAPEDLAAAIESETTRADSRYRDPDNHYAPGARDFLLSKRAMA